jgi:hypothetical protein
VRQGVEEGVFGRLTAALAIGGAAFIGNLRRKVPRRAGGETNARAWRRLLPFAEVVRAIETVRGERWDDFIGRHGDYGRDLALHIGRLKCGLTLRERGKEAGGMTVPGVAKACERMAERLKQDRTIQLLSSKIIKEINHHGVQIV